MEQMLNETVAGIPVWALVAGGGGLLLVLLILVIALRSKKDAEKPTIVRPTKAAEPSRSKSSAAAPAQPRALLTIDFSAGSKEAGLRDINDEARPVPGAFAADSVTLGAAQGLRTIQTAPVTVGATYLCDYVVRLARSGTNGAPVNFFVGPLMLNGAGEIIGWWVEGKPPVNASDSAGKVETVAPEGAVSMALGLSGPFASDGHHSDAAISFLRASVARA